MLKKIVIVVFLVTGLFAIDKDSVVAELSCKEYSFTDNLAGIYKEFDTTNQLWFLYMPKLNYLLVHETGKNKTSEGAIVVPTSDFSSITDEKVVMFGNYLGTNSKVGSLSNKTFSINDNLAGIYKEFDTTNQLWFLYMPKLNYLLVHETGKYKTSEGALVIPVSYFQSIDILQDPFGNSLGSVKFIAKNGCSDSSSSSSEASSSSSSSSSSSASYYQITSDLISGVKVQIEGNGEVNDLTFCPNGNYRDEGRDANDSWDDVGTWSVSDGKLIMHGSDGTYTATFNNAPAVDSTGTIEESTGGTLTFSINSILTGMTNDDCNISTPSDIEMPPMPPEFDSNSSEGVVMPPMPPSM